MEKLSYNYKCCGKKNCECKTDTPQSLKLAIINVYKLDKNICCKHIVAKNGCSISYRSRDEEAHKQNAESRRRQRAIAFTFDKAAQHGLPDRSTNFNCGKAEQKRKNKSLPKDSDKKKLSVEDKTFTFIPNSDTLR